MNTQRYEIEVRWKRHGWKQEQKHIYQTEEWAMRFIRKLESRNHPKYQHLAPIEYVKLRRREVGNWQDWQEFS